MKHLLFIISLFFLQACQMSDIPGHPPDFVTRHGLLVYVEQGNMPEQNDIESWTDLTIDFWKTNVKILSWNKCVDFSMIGFKSIFINADHIKERGKSYSGLANNDGWFIISNGPDWKIRGVFIHELSHVVLGQCANTWHKDIDHEIFADRKLCEKISYYC